MKSLITLFFLMLAGGVTAAEKPNIVFILIDDLGWADVSLHGGVVPTPNIDSLAKEGVHLKAHYVAPVCSPTRTGLMTGRYWSRFGVTTPQNEQALPFSTVTLPKLLKTVGYTTALIGKWHLGSLPEQGPNHFGFDYSYGSLAGGVGPYDHHYKKGPFQKTWHRNEKLLEEAGHVTDLLTNEALEWLNKRPEKPFFLYLPYTAVHLPVKEDVKWLEQVPADIKNDVARHYAACLIHLDASIGRIVDKLNQKGVRENTLIIFSSDNGGSTAENNGQSYPADDYPTGKLPGSNLPWRAEKGTVYEGGTRVTAFAHWKGKLKPREVETPLSITDWMPTLSALTGAMPESDLKWDGQNIWSVLADGAALPERPLYNIAPGFKSRSLRLGEWKLVEQKRDKKQPAQYALYNLKSDPAEQQDVAKSQPEMLERLLLSLDVTDNADNDSVVPRNGPKQPE
jgi:arylsulfatase A-like enzyme